MAVQKYEVLTMLNGLSVRLAQDKDVDVLVKFNMALARETEQKILSSPVVTKAVQTLLKNPHNGFYVVAEIKQQIVAALMITYEWSDWRCGLFWWIQSLYVKPRFRRKGVFTSLYEFIKQQACRNSNVCGFRVYVEKSNHLAQAAYTHAGMKQTPYKVYQQLFDQ